MNFERCPDREELRNWLVGKIEGDRQATIATHVETCGECQSVLDQSDQVISLIGEQQRRSGVDEGPDLEPALAKFRQVSEANTLKRSQSESEIVRSLRCPHCHAPVDTLKGEETATVKCHDCGRGFELLSDANLQQRSLVGDKISHFEIKDFLGAGSFGSVWKAYDTKLDRFVAIKVPRRHWIDESDIDQFLHEARAAAQVKNPNIVQVHEAGLANDTVFIVSDFVEGLSLDRWIKDNPLTKTEAAALVEKLARALHSAHEAGIVHRDLKPANIIIDANGQPHITDFGVAKRSTSELTVTAEGQIFGTLAYMPPEQARGDSHLADRRSDVYGLGAILFHLITGELPFRGSPEMVIVQILNDDPQSPRKLDGSVPRDLDTICLKCLEKEPQQRYDSANALAEDLRKFINHEPVSARPVGRVSRGLRWCKRKPVMASLTGLVASLSVLFVGALAAGTIISNNYANRANLRSEELAEAMIDLQKSSEQIERHAREAEDMVKMAQELINRHHTGAYQDLLFQAPEFSDLRNQILEDQLSFSQDVADLIERSPSFGTRESRLSLAKLLMDVGKLNSNIGDGKNALAAFDRAKQLLEKESADDELILLAKCHSIVGTLQIDQRDYGAAKNELEMAESIYQDLIVHDPDSLEIQSGYAETIKNLGHLANRTQNPVKAKNLYKKAIEQFDDLCDQSPEDDELQAKLADCHLTLGLLVGKLANSDPQHGSRQEAIESLRKVVEVLQPLAAKNPVRFVVELAKAKASLAVEYGHLRKFDQAYLQVANAIEMLEAICEKFPTIHSLNAQLATCCELSARLFQLEKKNPQQQLKLAEKCVALHETTLESIPNDIFTNDALAQSYGFLALIQRAQNKIEEARKSYEREASIRRKLASSYADDLQLQIKLGKCLSLMAGFIRDTESPQAALEIYEEAAEVWQRVQQKNRRPQILVDSITNFHVGRALTLELLSRYTEAAKDWESAGKQPQESVIVNRIQINHAICLARGMNHKAAKPIVDEIGRKGVEFLNSARAMSLCMVAVQQDATLGAEARDQLKNQFSQRAIQYLRQAVKKDVSLRQNLVKDKDFEPLWTNDEFKSLVKTDVDDRPN